MGNHEIERFLNHLAVNRGVSPGTQNQALCAIIFVYKHVLKREIENLQYKMTKTPRRMPTVLSPDEVASILQNAYSGEREHPYRLNVNTIFLNALPTGGFTPGVHVQSIF